MADELIEAMTPSDEELDSAQNFGKYAAYTAATGIGLGYAGGKTAQSLLSSVVDTQGYGINSPIEQYAKGGKVSQAMHNALQAGNYSLRGGARELVHSLVTGESLELKAMESRIKETERELRKDKRFRFLTEQERVNKKQELKNAKNTLAKRQLLVSNTKVAVGKDASMISIGDSHRTTKIVTPDIARIDPKMAPYVGKEIDALEHGPTQQKDFRGKANQDPRVSHIKKVFGSGNRNALANVRKALANAEYEYGKDIRSFERQIIDGKSLPVNRKGAVVGDMKLTQLKPGEGRYRLKNGAVTRTFRLGFVPINRMGHGKALEYVAGQHWQYMDFAKVDGRYVPVKGGMRDIHDLGVNKITRGVEKLFAKPILNTADWDITPRKLETKPRKSYIMEKLSKILPAASKQARIYAPEAAAKIDPSKLGKAARVALAALSIRKNPSTLWKEIGRK
jgi:hypothetical protein